MSVRVDVFCCLRSLDLLPCAHRLTEEHAEGDCSKSCARHAYEALRAAPSTDVVAVAPLMLQRNALCEKGGLERLLLKRARSNAACKGWDAVSVWVAGYCSVPVKVTDDSAEDVYDWLASMPDSPVSVKCRFLAVQQTLRRRVVQRRRTVVEAELTGQQIAAAVALASVQPTPSKTLHRFLERTAVKTKKTKKTREKPNSTQVQRTEAEARSKSRVLAVEQYYDKEDWASEQDARAAAASLWGEALEGRGLTMDDFYRVLSMQRKSPGAHQRLLSVRQESKKRKAEDDARVCSESDESDTNESDHSAERLVRHIATTERPTSAST